MAAHLEISSIWIYLQHTHTHTHEGVFETLKPLECDMSAGLMYQNYEIFRTATLSIRLEMINVDPDNISLHLHKHTHIHNNQLIYSIVQYIYKFNLSVSAHIRTETHTWNAHKM